MSGEAPVHGHEDPSATDLARMIVSRTLAADDPYAELGNIVFETRKNHGWRQQTLANMLGLSRASVANLETGRQRILFHTFLQLCNVLSKPMPECGDAADWLAEENRELRAQIAMLKAQKARKDGSSQQTSTGGEA